MTSRLKGLLKVGAYRAWSELCQLEELRPVKVEGNVDRRPIRIALVKSWQYTDLFGDNVQNLASYVDVSNFRTGPAYLFELGHTDCVILRDESVACAEIVAEKRRRGYYRPHHAEICDRQRDVSRRQSEVDWMAYDLIVAMDVAISLNELVDWNRCLIGFVEDYTLSAYRHLLAGDCGLVNGFSTQLFTPSPLAWCRRRHVVDLPYNWMSRSQLLDCLSKDSHTHSKDLIVVDGNVGSDLILELERAFGVRVVSTGARSLRTHWLLLHRAKYFVTCVGSAYRWGNQCVEAAAAGALIVAAKRQLVNSGLVSKGANVLTVAAAIQLIITLEEDAIMYGALQGEQESRFDEFVGRRPTAALLRLLKIRK